MRTGWPRAVSIELAGNAFHGVGIPDGEQAAERAVG
jgi:hypothetical protein